MLKNNISIGDKIFNVLLILVLLIFGLIVILPLLNLVSISVSDEYAIMRNEVTIFPKGFSLASYEKVFNTVSILRAYGNTIFVAVFGCVLSLLFTSLAAYPLAFAEFDGKRAYNMLIMFTLWFSGGMVPSFLVMSRLNLVDSLWSLIFNTLIGAFNAADRPSPNI